MKRQIENLMDLVGLDDNYIVLKALQPLSCAQPRKPVDAGNKSAGSLSMTHIRYVLE